MDSIYVVRTSIGDRSVTVTSTGPAVMVIIVLVGVICMLLRIGLCWSGIMRSPIHAYVIFVVELETRIAPDQDWDCSIAIGVRY